jgi:hypothetical protein
MVKTTPSTTMPRSTTTTTTTPSTTTITPPTGMLTMRQDAAAWKLGAAPMPHAPHGMMMMMPMMMPPPPPLVPSAWTAGGDMDYDAATARVRQARWHLACILNAQREAYARYTAVKALPQVAIAQARETARTRAVAVARAHAAQIIAEQAGYVRARAAREAEAQTAANAEGENDSSQKQWPIVPQVSTAVCPPRSASATRSAPGEFGQGPRKTSSSGKREAVNAGVQSANCAKSKAKISQTVTRDASDATVAAAKATAAASNARVTRRSSSSQLELLEQRAPSGAEPRHRGAVEEAKALLDPASSIDRTSLFAPTSVPATLGVEIITAADAGGVKRLRSERSNAPSPESSRESAEDAAATVNDERLPGRHVRAKSTKTTLPHTMLS